MIGALYFGAVIGVALVAVLIAESRLAREARSRAPRGRATGLRDAAVGTLPGAHVHVLGKLQARSSVLAGDGARCIARHTTVSSVPASKRSPVHQASEEVVAQGVYLLEGELRAELDLSDVIVEIPSRSRRVSRALVERDYPALAAKLPESDSGWYSVDEVVVPEGTPVRVTAIVLEPGTELGEGYRGAGAAREARLGPGEGAPVRVTTSRYPALFIALPYALGVLGGVLLLAQALAMIALALALVHV